MDPATLIVGIGSPHGDDQVGWRVAERLADRLRGTAEVRLARSPHELLDRLEGHARLIVCDGCRGRGTIGALRRWRWPSREIAAAMRPGSSHDWSLPMALALADHLGELPDKVTVFGIEIGESKPGEPLSAALAAKLDEIAAQIESELADA